MKKITLSFFVFTFVYILEGSALDRITTLNEKLKKIQKRELELKNNQIKYNQLMTKYKKISLKYQKTIEFCEKNNCKDETEEMRKKFKELDKSVETLDGMMDTDIASITSIKRIRKSIESLIELEISKNSISKKEIQEAVDSYEK